MTERCDNEGPSLGMGKRGRWGADKREGDEPLQDARKGYLRHDATLRPSMMVAMRGRWRWRVARRAINATSEGLMVREGEEVEFELLVRKRRRGAGSVQVSSGQGPGGDGAVRCGAVQFGSNPSSSSSPD